MLPAERRGPADARAYIRPLGKQQAPHTVHMEVHKVLCLPRDLTKRCACHEICTSSAGAQPTPGRTSDPLAGSKVLCLPRNLHMKVHKVLRLPRNLHIKRRCPADARAYIRALRLPRNLHVKRRCPADARAQHSAKSLAPRDKRPLWLAHSTLGIQHSLWLPQS